MKRKQHNLTWIPHFIVHNSKIVPFVIVAFMIGYEAGHLVSPPLQTVVLLPNLTCKACSLNISEVYSTSMVFG